MRNAPYPLAAHMGIIAARVNLHTYDQQHALSLPPDDAEKIINGIQIYQKHPHKRVAPENEVIWEHNGVTLTKPKTTKSDAKNKPVLIVPSLINQSYILDLCPDKSVLRYMNQKKMPAYLLDWGTLNDMPQSTSIDSIVSHINAAISYLNKQTGEKVNVVGYCMGGTLSILSASIDSSMIDRIVLLATPWDFKAENSALAQHIKMWSGHVLPALKEKQYLPSEWIQSLFASLDKKGAAKKFIKFAELEQDSDKAKLFVMVEDWLNDGVDLPGNIAQECINKWFVENQLMEQTYEINGVTINLSKIENKCLIVASKKDKIVSYESALNIRDKLNNTTCEVISPNVGHVGLIVGEKAHEKVWSPIISWLKA